MLVGTFESERDEAEKLRQEWKITVDPDAPMRRCFELASETLRGTPDWASAENLEKEFKKFDYKRFEMLRVDIPIRFAKLADWWDEESFDVKK
ncbi:hypothetical protein OA2633_08899 [Oceanicaulis sp. HTCC2633]|nr:hypothetical protein OA2633_08899 [Oceanicaulis sp. HTCC2633]